MCNFQNKDAKLEGVFGGCHSHSPYDMSRADRGIFYHRDQCMLFCQRLGGQAEDDLGETIPVER